MPDTNHTSSTTSTTSDNFLTRLPPEIFQRVMSYSDPESMYEIVAAVPSLGARFVDYCNYPEKSIAHMPGVTLLNHAGKVLKRNRTREAEIDLTFATRIVRCVPEMIVNRMQDDPSALGFITRDTVVIFTLVDEKAREWPEALRLLRKRGARVWTYTQYLAFGFLNARETALTLEKTKYRYNYGEYATMHRLRHINEIKNMNFSSLASLELFFSNCTKRPVIQGVNAPLLRRLQITYCNHFPVIKNNTFGFPAHYDSRNTFDRGIHHEGLILTFMDALERSSGHLTRSCPTTREEIMRDVDFGFDRYLHKAVVHGGPDAIMERLDLSNKVMVSWRRASHQLPDNKGIVMLETPMIVLFIFENLFPQPYVPVLVGARDLRGVRITTYHPGLKLNGLFRRKSMESVRMYCFEAYNYDTGDFDNDSLLIDEIDLWKAGTPREVHLYGCRANMDPETFDKKYVNHEPPPDPFAEFDDDELKRMVGYVEPEPQLYLKAK